MDLQVEEGRLLALKFFDVAEEIHLHQIETSRTLRSRAHRLRLSRAVPRAVKIANPPLTLRAGRRTLHWQGQEVRGTLTFRLYDFGAVSLLFSIPLAPGTPLEGLETWTNFPVSEAFEAFAEEALQSLLQEVGFALEGQEVKDLTEEYLIYYFQKLSVPLEVFRNQANLPALLYGERENFSPQICQDLWRHAFSYSTEDLVVIGWEAAVVYEPTGLMDVPDILEFAHVQLLELQYYDRLLDRELDRTYEQIEQPVRFHWTRWGRYRDMVRRLALRRIEITEVIERIQDAIKITEDVYYARVYRTAQEVFRSREQIQSLQRKLELAQEVYSWLQQEVSGLRLEALEFAILLLIFLELVVMLL